jgi:hypothetical protein
MDLLGNPLTTRPIQTDWEFTFQSYHGWQFGFIDNPDRQFGNGSVWTRTRTWSDSPEPLLILAGLHLAFDFNNLSHTDKYNRVAFRHEDAYQKILECDGCCSRSYCIDVEYHHYRPLPSPVEQPYRCRWKIECDVYAGRFVPSLLDVLLFSFLSVPLLVYLMQGHNPNSCNLNLLLDVGG